MYLLTTGYSPVHGSEDDPVLVGPFETKERREAFLERHGRVFRSKGEVYTPDEYDAEVDRRAAEDGLELPVSYGPLTS